MTDADIQQDVSFEGYSVRCKRGSLMLMELMHEHFDLSFHKFKRAMQNKTSKTKINQPTKNIYI